MRKVPYVEEKLRTDHTGRLFDTQKEMLAFWKVPKGTFDGRMRKGWAIKDCLLGRQEVAPRSDSSPECRTDHEGRLFDSKLDMLNYWHVPVGTFDDRRSKGWAIKDCLLGKDFKASVLEEDKRTDPYGNVFPSAKAMCEHYNRSYRAYACALSRGRSIAEALFGWEHSSRANKEDRTDHLGKVFRSIKEMCSYWNVLERTYRGRIEDGWSKERALTEDTKSTDHTCEDHLGNKYESVQAMCDRYNVFVETYRHRIKAGYSVQAALLTPIQTGHYAGWRCIQFVYESNDKVLYFLCRKGNQEEVLSKSELERK